MLRNSQREIEREASLSGDIYTMRTKLRSLQDQVDNGEKKVATLRDEVFLAMPQLFSDSKNIGAFSLFTFIQFETLRLITTAAYKHYGL